MTSRLCFGSGTSVLADMMMNYPALAPRMPDSPPANAKLLNDFIRRSVAHTIQSGGALKRMNFEVYRREPTGKEYHTGPRAAGRESAAWECVLSRKTCRD